MLHWLAMAILAGVGAPQDQDATERFFRANDGNEDGKLTRAEFPERMRAIFIRIDANGDGFVTKREDREFRARQRQQQELNSLKPDHADVKYGPHERNVFDIFIAEGGKRNTG